MKSLADYLQAKGVDAAKVIVEYKGEIYPPGSDLTAVAYEKDSAVEIFRVVAGG